MKPSLSVLGYRDQIVTKPKLASMNPCPRMAISKYEGEDCASEGARSGWNPSRRNEKDAVHKASPL